MAKPSAGPRGTVRQRLLREVSRQQAIHKAEAARQIGVGWSTIQHHVRSLVRERRLREIEYHGLRFLVPAETAPSRVARAVVMGIPEHRRVLQVLNGGREHRIQEIADRLKWSRKITRRCLYALVRVGLAQRTTDYHPRFHSTRAGRAAIGAKR